MYQNERHPTDTGLKGFNKRGGSGLRPLPALPFKGRETLCQILNEKSSMKDIYFYLFSMKSYKIPVQLLPPLEGEGGEGSFYQPPPVAVFVTFSKEISIYILNNRM